MLRSRSWTCNKSVLTAAIRDGEKGRQRQAKIRPTILVARSRERTISLIVLLFFSVLVVYFSSFDSEQESWISDFKERIFPKSRNDCALLFFGLPKQFEEQVFPTVMKHIIKRNPNCDIFAHSYKVSEVSNPRNNETGVPIKPESLYAMTDNVVMDTMEDFHSQHNITVYRQLWGVHNQAWLYPQSMDNMIKQWHSIEKVWDLMEEYGRKHSKVYNQVGLFRSDVIYLDDIYVFDSKAVVPRFASSPSNDRMFYGSYTNARFWAKTRFSNIPQAYEDGYLDEGLHSEIYMNEVLLPQMKDPVQKKDICFLRVRATGVVSTDDCGRLTGRRFRRKRESLKEWRHVCLLCDYYF